MGSILSIIGIFILAALKLEQFVYGKSGKQQSTTGHVTRRGIANIAGLRLSVKCWGIHPTSLLWHQSYVWLVPFFLLKSRIRTLNLPKWRSP